MNQPPRYNSTHIFKFFFPNMNLRNILKARGRKKWKRILEELKTSLFYHFSFLNCGAFSKIPVILRIQTKPCNRKECAEHLSHLFHLSSGKIEARRHSEFLFCVYQSGAASHLALRTRQPELTYR